MCCLSTEGGAEPKSAAAPVPVHLRSFQSAIQSEGKKCSVEVLPLPAGRLVAASCQVGISSRLKADWKEAVWTCLSDAA